MVNVHYMPDQIEAHLAAEERFQVTISDERELLRDTGVATAPGIDFDPVEGAHFMRISFAVSTPEVEDAIGRIGPWFASRNRRAGG